jgi:hypothetical protein
MLRLCLGFIICVVACKNIPPDVYPQPEPMTIADSVGAVWPAIIDVITERQLPIKTVDRPPKPSVAAEPMPPPPADPTPVGPPPAQPEPKPEPPPPLRPQPAEAGYAPGLDRVFLTGCDEGRLIHDFAPLFDSPTMEREIAEIALGGGPEDVCAGLPAILRDRRVTGVDVVYDVELIRFVGRSVVEGECMQRYQGRLYLLAKCTGQ